MPELPEIALSKKYVDSTALHKKIVKVAFPQKSLLQEPASHYLQALKGKELEETRRLGKYLFLRTGKENWLVLHFGMTGKLEYYKDGDPPEYSQMVLSFDNDFHLAFTCKRKLGKIFLTSSVEAFREKQGLGKDALDLDEEEFLELMKGRKGSIKTALTDQSRIAGIGNVYADEVLYQAKVHPKTGVPALSVKEKKQVYEQIHKVLTTVIQTDGERTELPPGFLVPHRGKEEDCPRRCSGKIKKITVSGRSTYFCPACQKEKK